MAVNLRIQKALQELSFQQREADFHHTSHEEELVPFDLMKRGDLRAVEEGSRIFRGGGLGTLSDDPLRHYQYLFVAAVTVACRVCIEGGLPAGLSYNLSDIYIRQADKCRTVQEIFDLQEAMMTEYTTQMQKNARTQFFSRPIYQCMELIDQDLQQPLTVAALAGELGISAAYLSTLFKKETGIAVSEYIRRKRVDMAKFLLHYTDFACIEIAEYLCFSSDAHFSNIFRKYTGQTPTQYRKEHFQTHD